MYRNIYKCTYRDIDQVELKRWRGQFPTEHFSFWKNIPKNGFIKFEIMIIVHYNLRKDSYVGIDVDIFNLFCIIIF